MRGFTLLEGIGVLSLFSILALTLVTSFQFDPTRLELAEERLINDLQYAKSLAMSRGGRFGIFFEPAFERYTVFQTSIATPVLDPANRAQNLVVNYSTDIHFSGLNLVSATFGGSATLLFDAQGTPRSGNGNALTTTGTIVISNSAGTASITVSPEVGRIVGL